MFILMEAEVLKGLRQLVGWTEGDGLFCPGGSASNMYAMNLARYQLFPEVKSQGLWGLPRLNIFTSPEVSNGCKHCMSVSESCVQDHTVVYVLSPQSHYSVKKGAAFLGIGTDNIVLVKVDDG